MEISKIFELRRSIYSLNDKSNLTQSEINKLIESCLKNAPSAFNSQSSRLIILYDSAYQNFWNKTLELLKSLTPPEKFSQTSQKINSFQQGIGTILFFEDREIVKNLQQQYPLYANNFPKWAIQANAMLQYMIWTTLAEKNIGASLQHYNPLVDEMVQKEFSAPKTWELIAQMPFGGIEQPAQAKTFEPISSRLKILS
ncbi:MAG: nitroreductase family protein [Alphaproteobacteria bacterium]|nr:nitroreductase family protein [Alphaproteobacteria bacterium]